MKSLHLKAGRDKSLKRRHPWIFSGAVERVDGSPASGETVLVKCGGPARRGRGLEPEVADQCEGLDF